MKFLTGLVNGHNEQHQKEKNIKYIQKDMRARDGAGHDHEKCDVNHDFHLCYNAYRLSKFNLCNN